MSGRSPRPPWSVCLSARLLCRALPWIPTMPSQLQEEPGGAAGLLEEVTAGARRKRGGVRGASPPRRRVTGCAPLWFAQTAPKCPRPGGARPSPGGGAGTGHPGCRRGGRALSGGRRLPHTRGSRGGGREGGRQSCSLTVGSLPRPLPPPQHPGQRRAHSLQPGMALQSLSEPRQDAAGPITVPPRDRQRRGVRALSSLHLSQENWAQPERQTQSQCCCPPVGWLSPKHEEQTPRGCGARRAAGRAGGADATGAPRTCPHGNFYVPSAFPQFFLHF